MEQTKQRIMLVINPISGTGTKRGVAGNAERELGSRGFDVDVRITSGRGDATRMAREAADAGYYGVLACGGDGTVNETARASADPRPRSGFSQPAQATAWPGISASPLTSTWPSTSSRKTTLSPWTTGR